MSRKVWTVTLDHGYLLEPGAQVMIEQFDDGPPAIAFRDREWDAWGVPHQSEVRS